MPSVDSDFLTLTSLLRGFSGINVVKSCAFLEEMSYEAALTRFKRICICGRTVHSRELDEVFADAPRQSSRVTPAGARLLVELYELDAFPKKLTRHPKRVEAFVLDYIASEERLVAETVNRGPAPRLRPADRADASTPDNVGDVLSTLFFAHKPATNRHRASRSTP